MPSYLPRQWGEPGALRVADVNSRPAPERIKVNSETQRWLREQEAHEIIDVGARQLRELNLKKAATSRHVRLSRVS